MSIANLDEFLTMAAEAAEVDMQNTHTTNAMDSAAEAETKEEFDRVSSRYFTVEKRCRT